MKDLTYFSNGNGWAIYNAHTGNRLAWGEFGSDLFFGFRELVGSLGMRLEAGGTMPEFNGEPPKENILS